jgi:hypothetical protein
MQQKLQKWELIKRLSEESLCVRVNIALFVPRALLINESQLI